MVKIVAQAVAVGRHEPVVAGPDKRGMIDFVFFEYAGQGLGLVGDNVDGLPTEFALDPVIIGMENLDVINEVHGPHGYVAQADAPLNCPIKMTAQTLPGLREKAQVQFLSGGVDDVPGFGYDFLDAVEGKQVLEAGLPDHGIELLFQQHDVGFELVPQALFQFLERQGDIHAFFDFKNDLLFYQAAQNVIDSRAGDAG